MIIKTIALKIANILPLRNCIIFESCPDLTDNTKPVFDEMLHRRINDKVKLIWIVEKEPSLYPKIKNVRYIKANNRLACSFHTLFSRVLISCNRFVTPRHKNQFSIYLTHGLPIKSVKSYYTMPNGIHYMVSPSDQVTDIMSNEFNAPVEKIVCLGFPRNDILSQRADISGLFDKKYRKIIVWYPTVRQNKAGRAHAGNALPVIHDANVAIRINECAKDLDVLIVLKPHFAQDTSYILDLGLSNIKIINDDFFDEKGISNYEFLSGSDALITDYSSVYYDYTLCDKPIGVIWEDIKEYELDPGFAVDLDQYLKGAEKLYTAEDLCNFIRNVAGGYDLLRSERNEVKNMVTFTDGMSSKRVVDFIIQNSNL